MNKKLLLPPSYLSALESYFDIPLEDPIPKKLKPFAATIAEMSKGLKKKKEREEFISGPYLNDPAICDAYLLYYTTCNLLKIYHPLDEIDRSGFFKTNRNMNVLDIGSGTGTMIYGMSLWLQALYPDNRIRFTAWDRSSLALRILEKFHSRVGGLDTLQTSIKDLEDPVTVSDTFHLITGGNVMNELAGGGEQNLLNLAEKFLHPDGFVILIEPALKESSRRLLQFRDRVVQNGWFVYAPCFTQNPCPALKQEDDWCHHDMDWERPAFIGVLDEMIGHIRKSLKFSYLILSRKDTHLADFLFPQRDFRGQFRVVSEILKEKGRRRLFVCNDHGRCECQKNNRDDNPGNEAFDDLTRYGIAEISGWVEKKELRLIEKETRVVRVNRSS